MEIHFLKNIKFFSFLYYQRCGKDYLKKLYHSSQIRCGEKSFEWENCPASDSLVQPCKSNISDNEVSLYLLIIQFSFFHVKTL